MSLGVRASAVAAIVAAIALGPGEARADLSAFVGTITFDSDANLNSSPAFGLRWGKSSGLLGGETSLTIARPDREIAAGSEEAATAILYEGRILLNFPAGQLRPFVGVGFGAVTVTSTDLPTDLDDAAAQALSTIGETKTNSAFSYGGGVRYKLSDKIDLRADVRQYQVFSVTGIAADQVKTRLEEGTGVAIPETDDGTVQHNEFSIGISFNF